MTKRMALTLICTLMVSACDERPSSPPPVALPPPPPSNPAATLPAEPARPTTQALTTGPRTTLALDVLPFSLSVPEGWALQTVAGIVVLTGATPNGDATIQLNFRSIEKATIPLIEMGAKEDLKKDPTINLLAEGRELGGVHVFERRWLGRPQASGEPRTLRWTITAYVPRDEHTSSVYELNFVGLTESQFNDDRNFLYSIIDTLKYDGTKSGRR